jgi:hypothetical protein
MMKSKQSITFRDLYRTLPIEVDYGLYKRILQEMCRIILNAILNSSDGFKMPFGLGFIQVGKYLPKALNDKSLSVDYKASREYNKRIYHLNEHSNGYKYRLYWSKIPRTFPDRYKYQLCFVRQNKRRLAQLIFNKQDYLDINDIQLYKV